MEDFSARNLESAIALAVHAHRGQRDKAGAPYILHPLRLLARLGHDATEAQRMAAVLHDVVEDTEYTLEKLAASGCPHDVLAALDCLTRRKGESYEQFIERLVPNEVARRVKRADLEDNMDLLRLPAVTSTDVERLARYRVAWNRVVGST
jgi:(p)ppGpp synthase/HD superfamily hydrolase